MVSRADQGWLAQGLWYLSGLNNACLLGQNKNHACARVEIDDFGRGPG
jgi:hypothetical protein